MAVFLFRCPVTGFRVQGWVADDDAPAVPVKYWTFIILVYPVIGTISFFSK